MVHDSFGVHANDVDALHRVSRGIRSHLFRTCMENFLTQQREAHPDLISLTPLNGKPEFAKYSPRPIFLHDIAGISEHSSP